MSFTNADPIICARFIHVFLVNRPSIHLRKVALKLAGVSPALRLTAELDTGPVARHCQRIAVVLPILIPSLPWDLAA